jgi:two-component sensor histidine kinase
MEREAGYALLDAVAFITGAELSVMLGLMQWRVDRSTRRVSGYLLLWILGFVWTFSNFLRSSLELGGVPADSSAARLAETLAWSCTLIGPITIGRLLQGAIGPGTRAARNFWKFALTISALNVYLFTLEVLGTGGVSDAGSYPPLSFYLGVFVASIAFAIYTVDQMGVRVDKRAPLRRWFAPIAVIFAGIHSAAIALSILFPRMPDALLTTTTLIARHWTIPWSVLIAVSLAQTHYADVVLKRSLWLLASVTLATLIGLRAETGLAQLMVTLAIAASLLAAPSAFRMLGSFVDRVILKRPEFTVGPLQEEFRRIAKPDQLIEAALTCLRKTLRVEARWMDTADNESPPALASTPVRGPDGLTHRLEIIASHQARTLMQSELAFLDSVGTQLEHRLDALHFEEEQRALLLREERLKRLLTEAELKALRTQVDPHFLFNTLNTIADLISTNPQQAERMTERLAECFRYALAKHSRDLSTLDEELDFARHYLDIEQVRFGDRLRVQLSRGDAVGTESVPSLLLQPLLENAIRHGLAPLREGGCVTVQAHREGERLHLSVEDDGVGLRADLHPGVGLRNVQERLRTLYAQAAEFLIGARPGGRGTRISIVIPLHAH